VHDDRRAHLSMLRRYWWDRICDLDRPLLPAAERPPLAGRALGTTWLPAPDTSDGRLQ
jgi:hypothetical protein